MADDPSDLEAALAEVDDAYLGVQLLLAVRRAGSDEPRRAGMWHALAGMLAAEQQRRRQRAGLAGATGQEDDLLPGASVVSEAREELRLDAQALDIESFRPEAG